MVDTTVVVFGEDAESFIEGLLFLSAMLAFGIVAIYKIIDAINNSLNREGQ